MRQAGAARKTLYSGSPILPLAMAMLLTSLGFSSVSVALPTLAHSFAVPIETVQWLILAYLIPLSAFVLVAGRIGDLVGRRRLLTTGLAVFALSSLACAAAPGFATLLAARACQGAGAAALTALAVAMVRDLIGAARVGRAMGLLGAASAIGTAAGPALGGSLISGFGWRAIFLATAIAALVNLVLASGLRVPTSGTRGARGAPIDAAGAGLLCLALAGVAIVATVQFPSPSHRIAACMSTLLAAFVFFHHQRRAISPLIPASAIAGDARRAGLIANLNVAAVMMATLVVGPFYLTATLSLGPFEIGMIMSIGPVLSALSGVPAGHLVDHFGSAPMVLLGLVGTTLAAFGLAVLPPILGLAGFLAAIALLTPAYQLFLAANNAAAMAATVESQRGTVSGLLGLSRNLGLIFGASAAGVVFAAASGPAVTPQDAATGLRFTFLAAGALLSVTLCLLLVAHRRERTA
ncbi:MAG: MFS transporter [Pseudomonadota bacterium]